MQEGLYRLFRAFPNGDTQQVARFSLQGKNITVLDDTDGIMQELVPGGRLDDRFFTRILSMAESPYWRVIHEGDIAQGYHDDLIPELR